MTATPVLLDSPGPQLYLKHVVSSPEDFRHGYLVVVILFSEHTSLREKKKLKENSVKVSWRVKNRTRWALRPDARAATGPGRRQDSVPATGEPTTKRREKPKKSTPGRGGNAGQRASSVPIHSWERRGGSRKRWKSPGTANLSASDSENGDLWIRHLRLSAPHQPVLIAPSSSSL